MSLDYSSCRHQLEEAHRSNSHGVILSEALLSILAFCSRDVFAWDSSGLLRATQVDVS